MEKNIARLRRAKTTRSHIRDLGVARLSVLRSGQHIYAQVFTADGSKVLASASTLQTEVKEGLKNGKNIGRRLQGRHADRRTRPCGWYRKGRFRPLGLPLSRPHQGVGRSCPRGWSQF